ncbi:MAG: ankyrin repeat domain-containing protein [Verrucomicrobia bacterium]|nr:ankyrin repeat domain-containing protein [Verrucomicrobiota bacterium]
MIKLAEMKESRPMELHDGVVSTTTDVWDMLSACRDGDLSRVREFIHRCPALGTCQYDYTTPLHFAVREGRIEVVRYLVEQGAIDPGYRTHPFLEPLLVFAEDRGVREITDLLKQSFNDPKLAHAGGDTGKIDHGQDETQRRFQELVDQNKHAEVEAMLRERPDLARNDLAFWGEGILMMPAKDGDRPMLELLMRHGARVPDLSKWGARYYFKHYETAAFLLENGMNPNHMNWRRFTLLHDMAFTGEVQKARLLLDHGADINAMDDDYSSTPPGYAAHWGKREMAAFLMERGAEVNKAGAPRATPMAWARRKGHADIETDLRQAGAS